MHVVQRLPMSADRSVDLSVATPSCFDPSIFGQLCSEISHHINQKTRLTRLTTGATDNHRLMVPSASPDLVFI